MSDNNRKLFKGSIFHTREYGKLEYLEDALIEVNNNGIIENVLRYGEDGYKDLLDSYLNSKNFLELSQGQYILPGFVDLHIHAPQWPQAGVALDEPLNIWLDECTFPLEAKYSDLDFAKEVYNDLVKVLLSKGTTTAMYFATVHNEASLELAKICAKLGQRGLVGKVVMDSKEANPDYYRDNSTEGALRNTEKFIQDVQKLAKETPQGVYPVITPRFVPSCTDEALKGLGELANKYNVHVQSHCSEGQWEHDYVFNRFGISDTEVLERFGLLGKKTVLAHCNFLSEDDAKIFAKTNTAIGHCPISNSYFANAVLPVKKFKNLGVDIGLGSDISGGFSPSLYDNIKHSVMVSRMLEDGVDSCKCQSDRGVDNSRISVAEAFYLATKGGGESLNLPIGSFEEGNACDFQIIDINAEGNKIPVFDTFTKPEYIFQKIMYLATNENIREVWVQGNLVYKNKI